MPFIPLCPVPWSPLEHKLLSFQHPTYPRSGDRWHFLCSSLSPTPQFSLEYSSSELPLRGLPFSSATRNPLHPPALTCCLPSLSLGSLRTWSPILSPSFLTPCHYPELLQGARTASQNPGFTSSTFSHASQSISR